MYFLSNLNQNCKMYLDQMLTLHCPTTGMQNGDEAAGRI